MELYIASPSRPKDYRIAAKGEPNWLPDGWFGPFLFGSLCAILGAGSTWVWYIPSFALLSIAVMCFGPHELYAEKRFNRLVRKGRIVRVPDEATGYIWSLLSDREKMLDATESIVRSRTLSEMRDMVEAFGVYQDAGYQTAARINAQSFAHAHLRMWVQEWRTNEQAIQEGARVERSLKSQHSALRY